jgi:hypothetical protein
VQPTARSRWSTIPTRLARASRTRLRKPRSTSTLSRSANQAHTCSQTSIVTIQMLQVQRGTRCCHIELAWTCCRSKRHTTTCRTQQSGASLTRLMSSMTRCQSRARLPTSSGCTPSAETRKRTSDFMCSMHVFKRESSTGSQRSGGAWRRCSGQHSGGRHGGVCSSQCRSWERMRTRTGAP